MESGVARILCGWGVLSVVFVLSASEVVALPPSDMGLASERARAAKAFTVQITTETSDVFLPKVMGGTGTGFIYSLTPTEGFIFTNKHVVAADPFDARRVQLSFNLDETTGKSEKIDGSVVFESSNFDFAVVKFDPRKLKKAGDRLKVVEVPEATEYEKLVEAGRTAMALGNPLGSRNNATFGTLNGNSYGKDWSISKRRFWGRSDYVNTDTAINPGNSGGPLVDLETGKVLGINTAIVKGANNHGYVTPILPLIEEWEQVKKRGEHTGERSVRAEFEGLTLEQIALEPELEALIRTEVPDFENIYEGIFMVAKNDGAGLKLGDIVLRVDNEPVGDQLEKMAWLVNTSEGVKVKFTVIRDRKVQNISVPVNVSTTGKNAAHNNYLMASGVVFQDLDGSSSYSLFDGGKGVLVSRVIPHSIAEQMTKLIPGVIVTAVIAAGKTTKVTSTAQLEAVLRSADGPYVRLVSHYPLILEGGAFHILRSPQVDYFPVTDEIVSSHELPLDKLKAAFDFSGKDIDSRLIAKHVKKAVAGLNACTAGLAGVAAGQS